MVSFNVFATIAISPSMTTRFQILMKM